MLDYSNLIHNVLNWLIIASAAGTAALVATGCVDTGVAIDCSGSWLSPAWTATATAVMGVMKTTINIVRDGFAGMFKRQPPVE